jgi:hypothetical protein
MTRSEEIRQRLAQINAQIENAKAPESLPELPAVKASDSEGIKNLQERLRSLGYYTGAVDGKWEKLTQAAVQQYNQARQTREGRISEAQAPMKPLLEEQARLSKELSEVSRQEANSTPGEVTKRIAIQAVPGAAGTAWAFKKAPGIEQRLQIKDAARTSGANALAADIEAVDPKSPLAREQYRALSTQAKQSGYYKTGRGANSLIPSALPIALGAASRFGAAPAFYAQGQDTAGDIFTAGGAAQMGLGATQLFLGGLNNSLTPQVIPDSAVARFRMADAAARTTKNGPALASAVPPSATGAPSNALLRGADAIDVPPEPAPQPIAAEQRLAHDPRYQQYLADQEAILRGQAAARRAQPNAMPLGASMATEAPAAPVANALLSPPAQAALPPPAPPEASAAPLTPEPVRAASGGGDLAELQARLQASQDPAEIAALKARIAELQGQIDAQAARRAAGVEKAGVTRATNAGAERLAAAPAAKMIDRAKVIDPEANWTGARGVLENENRRIGKMTADQLRTELEALGQSGEGLSRGRMMTLLMRAKTFGVPAAIGTGAAALALSAGSNPADAAPQGEDEGLAHYAARRAYPYAAAAVDAGSYLTPFVGPARVGGELLATGANAAEAATAPGSVIPPDNAPQTLRGNLEARRQYGVTNVPPLEPIEYADPRLPDPRAAEHEDRAAGIANARRQDVLQRQRAMEGTGAAYSAAPPSSFDAALERLKTALEAMRAWSAPSPPPPPSNALLHR